MPRKLTTAAMTAAMIAATLAVAPFAGASSSPKNTPVIAASPTSSTLATVDKATLKRQAQLDALADQITGTSGTEAEHVGGYGGVVVHPKTGELSVYWKGDVPQNVKDVQASAAAKGLKVTVSPAAYSAQELEAARDSLKKAVKGKDAATEPVAAWNSIAVLPDGSGLSVTYNSPTSQPAPSAKSAKSAKSTTHPISAQRITSTSAVDVAARAQTLAGVPVQAASAPEMEDTSTRVSDVSPFWAGAQLTNPDGSWCSSGFGGTYTGTGSKIILTASHCATSGEFTTPQGVKEGYAGISNTDYDTTFVNVIGESGKQFYDGAWNDSTGYHKHVASWGLNKAGDYVCTSGSMSGIHCNILVQYAGITMNIGGIDRQNVVKAIRTDTSMAVAGGDSGGPVVTSPDGTYSNDNMQARGLISAGWGSTVTCPAGSVANSGTTCYEGVAFIGMSAIVNKMGFNLNT